MIPEQAESGKIVIYIADDFPRKWREFSVVADFCGLDPTIIFDDGRWWLFAAREQANGSENTQLFLWSSTSLEGPWVWHPQNPIKTDVRSSRPGGRPFIMDSKWIRPSQDCSVTYGGQLVFNEIEQLTEKNYKEKTIVSRAPFGNSSGMHTFDFDGDFCIVDTLKLEKSFPYFLSYCKNKIIRTR
jgi:beta-xylosidase